ncbi:MarR family winged helix-turn-helix transcriptional regulator [Aureimonas pseudogalii]|uniref:DNA-binding MarR family transcriptional regulator n=1 Tax=Aureimonas pseudogalii TaxID=1744844 RepID=A0A7W6H8F1_9HYPH|nr:MarR family winged helix-turn-helix transcriptional regulator [Aureimonas pseudogalii]MBB4000328.1 DNA-binding MarR family transcriptional regulator [Aureimonas pseudogalii]
MDQVDRILDQWRRERPDLDVAPMGTIGRLKRLSAHLGLGMDKVITTHGLNAASFDMLATLRRSGPPYALSPSALMEWTMVTSGTMTNRIDRLEMAGLVGRARDPDDGRGSVVGLTAEGFALIDRIVGEHVANQQHLTEVLSETERSQLDRLLGKWLTAFEE